MHHKHNIVKHQLLNIIISIDYIKLKENSVDLLKKDLLRELIYSSSRKMSLKPFFKKIYVMMIIIPS
jgi:hypothetical protein